MNKLLQNCLNQLQLEQQPTLETLFKAVESTYRRSFFRIPLGMPSNIFGAWVSHEKLPHEYIAYNSELPIPHREFVILHELSHFLLGHKKCLVRNVDEFINRIQEGDAHLRSSLKYNLKSEIEAETLAIHLQSLISKQESVYFETIGIL